MYNYKIEEIINTSQEKDWKKIYIICQCFYHILEGFTNYLNSTTVQSIILQKYIPDLYSGLLQLGYAPLGKPVNRNRPPIPSQNSNSTHLPRTPGQINTSTQVINFDQINKPVTPGNLASSMENLSLNQKNERIIYKEKSVAMFNDIYLR